MYKNRVFLPKKSEEKAYNCTFLAITSDFLFFYFIYTTYIFHKRIYIYFFFIRACAREKNFKRFFLIKGREKSGREKKKKLRQKEKEKAHKEKTPCRLASYSWLHEKGQKPFPFCRWYTTVWFLSRLTILNITIERLGISSGSIVTSRAITSSTLLKPTSVSSATFCPL